MNEARQFDKVVGGEPGSLVRLADAEEVTQGLIGLFSLCAIVLAVLTIIWWYQAYSAIDRSGATGRSWSSGWAVGGWFIPFANFVIPKLVLNEIDRVSAVAAEGSGEWRSRPLLSIANWWWAAFVTGAVLFAAGSGITADQVERGVTDADLYSTGLWLTAAGLAVDVAAALFGAAAIRVLGSRLTRSTPKTGVVP
ncbi:MAG: DUF4328 domain-containing protein [Actinomycetota bacterium]